MALPPSRKFRVVAILAVRNEEQYLDRCLQHLVQQGIETYIIDNGSTDGSGAIATKYVDRGVIGVETYPYNGFYDWLGILTRKEELARSLDADWFLHYDTDEIRYAPVGWGTLRHALQRLDRLGFSACNFEEFVFLPRSGEDFSGTDYVRRMKHYYFFEPSPLRQIKAWKKHPEIDIKSSGGHQARFPHIKLFPQPFLLCHYIALSDQGLRQKYQSRVYSEHEVKVLRWHGNRIRAQERAHWDLDTSQLRKRGPFKKLLSRTNPHQKHLFDSP